MILSLKNTKLNSEEMVRCRWNMQANPRLPDLAAFSLGKIRGRKHFEREESNVKEIKPLSFVSMLNYEHKKKGK